MSNKPTTVRVYWSTDSGVIESDVIAAIEDRGRVIRFADGGWNPTADCYLTETQCRRAPNYKFREMKPELSAP